MPLPVTTQTWTIDGLPLSRVVEGDEWDVWFRKTTLVEEDIVLGTGVIITDVGGVEHSPLQLTFAFADETERLTLEGFQDGFVHTIVSPTTRSANVLLVDTLPRSTNGMRFLQCTFQMVT